MEPLPGSERTPPSGSGIISRPLSSGPVIPPLVDWQAVPFEIMNPTLTAPHGGSFASSLNFRRCDQDLMFQTHPSLYAPINLPLSDLPEPGDTTSLYPLTPESGSDANGDANTIAEDRHSIHALLSDTERSVSNSETLSPGSNHKHGFWNTVLCSSHHGRNSSTADVLEFVPAARPEIVPVPPLPSPRKHLSAFSIEDPKFFDQPSLLARLPVLDAQKAEEQPSVQPKEKSERQEIQERKERQDRPYECNQCGLRFRKRCNAINHTKIVHEKLRPYKCAFCDRAFGKKSNCQKHEKLHTGHKYAQRASNTNTLQHIPMPQVSRGSIQLPKPVPQRSQATPQKASGPSSPAGIAAFFGELGD